MPLTLSYLGNTALPVEMAGFTPEWACDKSLTAIENFEVLHGNNKIPLAELFRVTGNASDKQLVFSGDLSSVHGLGTHMQTGSMHFLGNVGRHAGSEMRGGSIIIEGHASDWLACHMHGGLIQVRGKVGNYAGAAYRGAARGMTGGTLLIHGSAGHEVGAYMRRGFIAVAGSAGDLVGFNMLAGTIFIFGDCGSRAGAGMKRGTLGLFGETPKLLPSFRYAATTRPVILPVLLRYLQQHHFPIAATLEPTAFTCYQGDFVTLGRGEIFTTVANVPSLALPK